MYGQPQLAYCYNRFHSYAWHSAPEAVLNKLYHNCKSRSHIRLLFSSFFEILDLFGCNQNKDCCRNVGNLVKSLIYPSWGLMCNSSFPATFCFCEQHLINTDVHYSVNHLALKRWGELVAVESAWTEKTKTNKSSAPLFCKYKHRASVTWSVRYMLKIKGNC